MLARAILSSPDVLLLDEPTNHLDFQAVEFLEEYLAKSRSAYLVVTHDRRFLDRVAEEIVDLENGRLTAYSGGYTAYRRQKAERILSATRAFEKQQDFIDKEKEYIRRNIAGVNSRQAKGRRTKLARVERLEKPTEDGRPWPSGSTPRESAGGSSCAPRTSMRATRRARRSCGASPSSSCAASASRSSARTARGRRRS